VHDDVDDDAQALPLSLSSIARDSLTAFLRDLDDFAGTYLSGWVVIIKEALDIMRHCFLRKVIKQHRDKLVRV